MFHILLLEPWGVCDIIGLFTEKKVQKNEAYFLGWQYEEDITLFSVSDLLLSSLYGLSLKQKCIKML